MHQSVILSHLLGEQLYLFWHIVGTTSVRRYRTMSATNRCIALSTALRALRLAAYILRVTLDVLIAGAMWFFFSHLRDLTQRAFYRDAFGVLIRDGIYTVIKVFIRLLEWKCMDSFQRLTFNFDLLLVDEVCINTAGWLAYQTTCVGEIWVHLECKLRLVFCLVQMTLH